jgi:hypothetical protein
LQEQQTQVVVVAVEEINQVVTKEMVQVAGLV